MFRKTTLVVAALAMMVLVPQAQAAKGDWMIDFNAGTAIPMGDFKDGAKLGFMGGVGVGYMVTEAVCIGADGAFIMNKGSDDLNAFYTGLATAPVEAKFSMISGGAHAKYMFPMSGESKISPYVIVGLGVYNMKAKLESADPLFNGDESENKFGGRGGLGFSYKASENVGVGVEGAFNYINTDVSSTQFVGVQAGVTVGLSKAQ